MRQSRIPRLESDCSVTALETGRLSNKTVYLGKTIRKQAVDAVTGDFVSLAGEPYYQISNFDRLRPFFMSIVSDSDHWMYLSSNGGLTAGRRNPEHALFPYYTDDKIHDSWDLTGSKTLILVDTPQRRFLWEPFSAVSRDVYDLQRNLYKSVYGNSILFEEVNRDLLLTFFYSWSNSDAYGFVKRSGLRNHGSAPVRAHPGWNSEPVARRRGSLAAEHQQHVAGRL